MLAIIMSQSVIELVLIDILLITSHNWFQYVSSLPTI